jgi:hypothetical protein
MMKLLNSEKGSSKIRGLLVLLIVIAGLFILVQYARTKIKIEDMRSTVKEEAVGAKIRETWNDIIVDNILSKATDLNIITPEDIQNDTWQDKLQIEINRPVPDRIQLKVSFKLTTDYLVTKKVQDILLEESAKIYDF